MVSHFSAKAPIESTPVCEVDLRQTLVDLLRGRLAGQSNQTAYTFLVDGETEEVSLTYGELDARARAIAARLQRLDAYSERVLLLYPPDLEYIAAFFGCLYAGAVAVPIFAPRANRSLSRLQAIAADAEAKVVLTTSAVFARIEPFLAQVSELQAMHWLATDNLEDESVQEWTQPYLDSDTLAFIQYTSGSTASPKGVMVSHGNILHNEKMIQSAFRQTEQSVILSWLPLYHDMGLIGGVLQPLYVGARCILMSPVSFLQKPSRWLAAISRYRATTSGGPNFAYDLCVQKIDPARRAELDLSSWSVAFNGSEPVRAETLQQFAQAFASCGFRPEAFFPCYGLAEATLFVTGNPAVRPPVIKTFAAEALAKHRVEEQATDVDAQELVSCGATFLGQKTLIVNPETSTQCGPNEVGEIWTAGDSVAKGYWKRSEETQNVFRARLLGVPCETFLRTGDLGFLHRGELFVTGRLKDLIIIRGRNLYPQDIEQTVVECHVDLRRGGSVAFSVEMEGEERLVVVQELERHASSDLDALIQRVRQAISEEHEVQPVGIALVRAGSVPKTSSGKLQRRACRAMFLAGSFETLAEWREDTTQPAETLLAVPAFEPENETDIREFLKSLFATRLGTAAAEVDVDEPLARYALDSLQAIELMHAVEVSLGIVLPMTSFMQSPSIAELAHQAMQYLTAKRLSENEARANAGASILPNTLTTHAPSYGQQALWLVSRLAPESAAYNVASAVRILSAADPGALRRALQKLIERHASLRTTFNSIEGTPVAVVYEEVEVSFDFADASSWDEALLQKRLVDLTLRPFNLETGPLFRVHLFKRSEQEYVLLWVAHHIVVDFWSLVILVHELGELYEAEQHGRAASLAAVSETYSGYVNWQAEMLEGRAGQQLRSYWEEQLGGTLPVLNLPGDHPRPAVQSYRGSSYDFALDVGLTRQLKALGKNHDATLYMTLLGAFQVLLHRYTGQDDILVGSPAAARSRAAFSNVVGYFVNPIVLRADLSANPSFTKFLSSVRRTVLDAFAHQDYPFALLVKQLQPERDLSRSPLFQASFVLQQAQLLKEQGLTAFALGQGGAPLRLGELVLETMALEQRVTQFDLSLVMAEIGGELRACLEYNTDIFDETTIAQMVQQFRVLLDGIVADASQSVSSLPLLSTEDRRQVLVDWNESDRDFPQAACLHQIFEDQVEQTPQATAVTFASESLTYADLNRRANQLAHRLIKLGVGPEVPVAICMERSLDLPIALLAVLKAGGAYVPLEPSYPRERLAFIIEEACAPVILAQRAIAEEQSFAGVHVISLDSDFDELARESTENPNSGVTDENLCYVIYTSGSTGQPKGAMLHHRGVRNRLLWGITDYKLGSGDVVLHKTPLTFDVSVWEIFAPLLSGARLLIARPGGHQDAAYQLELMTRERVTHVDYVPTMLEVLLEADGLERCDHLKIVTAAGEALTRELRDRFYSQTNAKLYNLYGPTEASLAVTYWVCEPDGAERVIPIGRPMSNVKIYILDKQLQPVPLGVAGELHIGGVAPGRGYLKRPDLTADKFIPDAFSERGGERLYKTGDLARYRSDGAIEFLGRLDHQLKIRGMRMELGEVEAALCQHAAVREAVILAHELTAGNKSLVAYVVSKQEPLPTSDELRNYLRQRLPEYMVPAAFVILSELPLLSNGKLDRRALPNPEEFFSDSEAAYIAPESDLEQTIAAVWQQVFNVEKVSIHSNFFDLGGNSLLLAKVHSKLRAALNRDIQIVELFKYTTIFSLAKYLSETEAKPVLLDSGREQADLRKKLMKRRRSVPERAAAGV